MKKTKRTQTALAGMLKTSRATVGTWQSRADWPGDDAPEAELFRYAAARQRESARAKHGPDGDLKREKLARQIRLLEAQAERCEHEAETARLRLLKDKGELVEMSRHRDSLMAVVGLAFACWERALNTIAAKRKDAELQKELSQAMHDARLSVLAECPGRGDNTDEKQS